MRVTKQAQDYRATLAIALAATVIVITAPAARAESTDVHETAVVTDKRVDPVLKMRRRWILSGEWVTHAPLDVGVQAGFETPFGLRVFGGYGWVPSVFTALIARVAASAAGDAQAQAVLEHASYAGHTYWFQLGIHPLRSFGLYGDVGYSRATLDGGLVLAGSGVTALQDLPGSYNSRVIVDLWRAEIGIQNEFADRIVVGLALGVMGALDSHTSITPAGGAPKSAALDEAAARTDAALKSYGKVPSVTFRVGVDLI